MDNLFINDEGQVVELEVSEDTARPALEQQPEVAASAQGPKNFMVMSATSSSRTSRDGAVGAAHDEDGGSRNYCPPAPEDFFAEFTDQMNYTAVRLTWFVEDVEGGENTNFFFEVQQDIILQDHGKRSLPRSRRFQVPHNADVEEQQYSVAGLQVGKLYRFAVRSGSIAGGDHDPGVVEGNANATFPAPPSPLPGCYSFSEFSPTV
ncbi:unnamed protein product, partial [Amoebophrya sp. A120]|eukprot:GSA120T00012070001.1